MLRQPPDILITTPESLYLMLTGRAQELFAGAESVHRRRDPRGRGDQARRAPGADARAARARAAGRDVQRIGLSATQRPLEEIGRFLVGPTRECRIVDAGDPQASSTSRSGPGRVDGRARRPAAPDLDPLAGGRGDPPLDLARDLPGAARARPRAPLDDRLRQQPPRRRAARAAPERAGRATRSRAPTTARSRARSGPSSRSC